MAVTIAKVHDLLSGADEVQGVSVLADRLWPRGISKSDFTPDHWLTGATPSSELRKWFDHDPSLFDEFSTRYRSELDDGDADVDKLLDLCRAGDVTLVYAAADREHNHARVLAGWIKENI